MSPLGRGRITRLAFANQERLDSLQRGMRCSLSPRERVRVREPDVANQNGRTNFARSTRLAPRAGGLCYPKINFRLPSENDWRKSPRALVFRAFFPPHPGPLPWGEGESSAVW